MRKIYSKIPGTLPPPFKNEIDGKITDLSSKTIVELLELRDRQFKLLNNKGFISKLSDKGARILTFYNKIEKELKAKQKEEETCSLLDNLKITNITSLQDIEWDGTTKTKPCTLLDSDDDSEPEDVLHILSQSTVQEKKVIVLPSEKPLVTAKDLVAIGENPHVTYLVNKTEKQIQTQSIEKFKPYKTTKSNVHDPKNEIKRKKHNKWEITSATPPPILHGPVKILNLEESLKLQKEQNMLLKDVEARHAAEKLMQRRGLTIGEMPKDTSVFGKYRQVESEDSISNSEVESEKEIQDEEPERGGVVFTVMQ